MTNDKDLPQGTRFACMDCHRTVTVGSDGTEYGHQRGLVGGYATRCPRRPDCVDPDKFDHEVTVHDD